MTARWLRGMLLATLLVSGCGSPARTPYGLADAARPRIINMTDLRYNADDPAQRFERLGPPLAIGQEIRYLALSGGGADGAFGAGALNGLTDAGTRPEFSAVSGVSTGALIAPFAFLGSRYDAVLRELYTSGIGESLVQGQNALSALATSGLLANNRLHDLVARYVDRPLLAAIAAENRRGRRLFVATTNLDTQRASLWDMGRIAEIGTDEALALFRDVLTASASSPGIFPPVLIEAEANGRRFREMHVDGGVSAPVLTFPDSFLLRGRRLPHAPPLNLYVLINGKISPDFRVVPDQLSDIATRSAATLVKTQTRSIVYQSHAFTQRNGFSYHLTYVAPDISTFGSEHFSTAYMRMLYRHGYERARAGRLWSAAPP